MPTKERPDQEGNLDNVVIGEMTGLQDSTDSIRVETGAGDDLLQVTGLLCNNWNLSQKSCLSWYRYQYIVISRPETEQTFPAT